MLDVHPPHHAANTWRDFFIHIATIVVGLLIAVGLEQTVEYFHHRHQRHLLIDSLEGDTAICEEDGRDMSQSTRLYAAWLLDREKRINEALWSGHAATDLPDPPAKRGFEIPSYTHFQAAKASGLLQLLSTEDMDAYSEVNFEVELAYTAQNHIVEAEHARGAFEATFVDRDFKRLDLSRASAAELREYLHLLEDERIAVRKAKQRANEMQGAAAAVLSGQRGIRNLQQAENAMAGQEEQTAPASH